MTFAQAAAEATTPDNPAFVAAAWVALALLVAAATTLTLWVRYADQVAGWVTRQRRFRRDRCTCQPRVPNPRTIPGLSTSARRVLDHEAANAGRGTGRWTA